ncbi:MAG: ribose 5-phosphate isomerase [Chloroflexia bacterium]|jgi:ribose 5-phosphate isomerase A|nr:ribose 5-phosphate isomerase [Chloroflexia bacterium]
MSDVQQLKHEAALRAVEYVRDGMVLGLGTGSTATFAVREIGRRVGEGLRIRGVPTSERTATLATELGIPLVTLDDVEGIDLTIDGADEVDLSTLNVIKGLGGALLREKLVALATAEVVLIVDESKVVPQLGDHAPLPVEVVPFGWSRTCSALHALGCTTERRTRDGEPYITDSGNYLIDCRFQGIPDPATLAQKVKGISGVVEHGLFVGIARRVVTASSDGVKVVER